MSGQHRKPRRRPAGKRQWELVRRLPQNSAGRDIVVGDVHGHFSRLADELARIDFDTDCDRLLAVGDLVDRGPESAEVAHWIKQPWFHAVLGNHELSALASQGRLCSITGSDAHRWVCDAHTWLPDLAEEQQGEVLDALASLPVAIEVETQEGLVGIVHAEVSQHSWWDFIHDLNEEAYRATAVHEAAWQRDLFRGAHDVDTESPNDEHFQLAGVLHVIHGHSPARDLRVKRLSNRYYIDTGGWLTHLGARYGTQPRFTLVAIDAPGAPL